jgi:hypothetical protein
MSGTTASDIGSGAAMIGAADSIRMESAKRKQPLILFPSGNVFVEVSDHGGLPRKPKRGADGGSVLRYFKALRAQYPQQATR